MAGFEAAGTLRWHSAARRAATSTASSRAASRPGASPRRLHTTRAGIPTYPMAARGIRPPGTTMAAWPQAAASPARAPPVVTATIRAPRSAAWRKALRVSSVSPEYETANTSVSGPTQAGTS